MQRLDLSGQRFSGITIVRQSSKRKCSGDIVWHFICDCGKPGKATASNIKRGGVKSCGCAKTSALGLSTSREARSLYDAIRRCDDTKDAAYHNYGSRGITVCSRWRLPNGVGIRNMLKDLGPCPKGMTLERRDGNKGYSKSNCKWATRQEQNRNKRTNVLVEYKGKKRLLIEWSEKIGINSSTLYARIYSYGWSVQKALTTPLMVIRS